jgi:hypothetical protein
MSEIATYCGSWILPRMYNGEEPESDTTNQWLIQPHPPKGAWMIWKKYLGFMVTSQTTLSLSHPPGKWKEVSPRNPWQYHEPSNRLQFQHSQGTREYHSIRETTRRSRNRGFVQAGEINEPPSDTVDTIIWQKTNTNYMPGHREHEQSVAQYIKAQKQYALLL